MMNGATLKCCVEMEYVGDSGIGEHVYRCSTCERQVRFIADPALGSAPSAPQPDNRDLALDIIKRCAAYVRGFAFNEPPIFPSTRRQTLLQHVADMMEAQPNAIIATAGLQPSASQEEPTQANRTELVDRITRYLGTSDEPTMIDCPRCKGEGSHHGFGEGGRDPDWCEDCGGIGSVLHPDENVNPDDLLRLVLEALSSSAQPVHAWSPDATGTACAVCGGYPGQHGADGGEVVVACECGNRDTITLPLTAMPPCSGGCGRRMRVVGVYVGAAEALSSSAPVERTLTREAVDEAKFHKGTNPCADHPDAQWEPACLACIAEHEAQPSPETPAKVYERIEDESEALPRVSANEVKAALGATEIVRTPREREVFIDGFASGVCATKSAGALEWTPEQGYAAYVSDRKPRNPLPNRFDCPECGIGIKACEDGTCASCGADVTIIANGKPLSAETPESRKEWRVPTSLEELADHQGVKPIHDITELQGDVIPDGVDIDVELDAIRKGEEGR